MTETEDIVLREYNKETGEVGIILRQPKRRQKPEDIMRMYLTSQCVLHKKIESMKRLYIKDNNYLNYIKLDDIEKEEQCKLEDYYLNELMELQNG